MAVLSGVPVGLVVITGSDQVWDGPVYAGMAAVLVASFGYAVFLRR